MTRRAIPLTIVTLATLLLTSSAAPGAPSVGSGDSSYRSDAWIKLCGQSTGCVIDPLPHPWLGKDVYNTTGRRQTIAVDVNEGEDVRFWITVQNDGTETDTLAVQGCDGTRYFEVRHVVLGKQKRPNAAATEVTRKFKDGTLTFDGRGEDGGVHPPGRHASREEHHLRVPHDGPLPERLDVAGHGRREDDHLLNAQKYGR